MDAEHAAPDKRGYYSEDEVVRDYDDRRFGGRSGRYVHDREVELILGFLPASGRVLDLPCGTGRVAVELMKRGYEVTGADGSPAMLRASRGRGLGRLVHTDAFAPGLKPGSFDAVVSSRFGFHFEDLDRTLRALASLVKPGGRVITDLFNWSPRTSVPILRSRFGGRVFIHGSDAVKRSAERAGLSVRDQASAFLFTPMGYRYLPFRVVRGLDAMERLTPERLRVKTYYCLEK